MATRSDSNRTGVERLNPLAPQQAPTAGKGEESSRHWTFFTNHAHVLVCLSRDANETVRSMALRIGITERAVQSIMRDLEEAGIITRHKQGRRNHYEVNTRAKLRHDLEAHKTVGDLIAMVNVGIYTPTEEA